MFRAQRHSWIRQWRCAQNQPTGLKVLKKFGALLFYISNTHQKIGFVLWLGAQEQSQFQIATVIMAILQSRGLHGTKKQGKPNLT